IAGAAALHVEFSDSDGFVIPADYDRLVAARADARTIPVEVYSRRFQSALDSAHYAATRLIVAPPRAAAAKIALPPDAPCEVGRLELERVRLAELRGGGKSPLVAAFGARIERLQAALRASGAGGLPAGVDLRRPLLDQIAALAPAASEFDWKALRKDSLVPHAMALVDKRRRLAARDGVIAFIGGERLYHKLCSHARVLLVDEADPAAALSLRPDALVVEACVEALLGQWRQELCGAAGQLSPAASKMLAGARKLGIPVQVIAPSRADELELYRELLAAADLVLLEGLHDRVLPVDWLAPAKTFAVPRSFERTVAAPVVDMAFPGFRLIVPTAAAILANEAHASLIAALDAPNLLLAEAFVDLSETQVSNLLPFSKSVLVGTCQHVELLYYLEHSDAVLLFMDAPVLDAELQDLVLDATACGAMVIALGDIARLGPLAAYVTPASDPSRVLELLGLYAHVHYREQLWLSRYRALCREHGFERIMRLLQGGRGAEDDLPLASIVTATKRPHLLDRILANYSRQTYPNKELIIVLHGAPDAVLEIPPELAPAVRVIHAPAIVNLGFCLNEGIRQAAGDIWFKVDDDDYYGPHYIEDMINAYRFSGADIVGKPTYLVYLEESGQTVCRTVREARKRKFYNHRPNKVPRLTGATLSARRVAGGPFSLRRRSGVDSEWTERMANSGNVLFSSDYLNFVVYRGADKSHHTWTMADERFLSSGTLMGSGLTEHMA
ncbi:MAG TPA: glycosyltransferase family 2 protein, partial [Propylenella sp.]|nr:glycosyltransferase family 2 protein [Propylenella sp.]